MKTDIKMFKRPGTIRSHKTEMITGVNDNETLPLKTELVVSWYSWCLFEVFGYFVSVCVRLSGAPQILTDASADVVGSLVPAPVNLELSSSDIFEFCGFPSLWFMLCLRVVPTCLRSASLCFLFYFDSLCWASLCLLTLNLSQLFPHVVPLPDHLLSVYIVRVSPWPLLHCEISYVNISKVFLVIRVLCLCISSSQCRCFSVCKCALINGTPSVSLSLCPVVGVWFLTQNTWSVSGYRDSWSTGGANTVCWASTQRALLHQYVLIFGLLGAGRINHWRQKEKWSHVMLDKLTWTVRGKAEGLKKYGDCDWTAVQNSIVGLYLNVFAQGDCLKRWKCR